MSKTYRRKRGGSTRKNKKMIYSNSCVKQFEKEVTVVFLEMLLLVKLFHWKTHSYATHKATDELYTTLNENIDKFVEVLLGKTGSRINLLNQKTIKIEDLDSQDKLKQRVETFKSYLVGLTDNKAIKQMTNTDLLNIRDEILGDMNKFLYLLTFK
uniref:Uncharacterized protein n=1 Tax=viral metagenome TaxID=1070528 RepID=A0A6C0ERV1_9ZZZZ